MKTISKLATTAVASLFAVMLIGQTTSKTPTSQEAKTTCITLRNLLEIAAREDHAADAAALSRAYKLAVQYVSDSSSVQAQTKWVQRFDGANPDLAEVYVPTKGGFNNRTIDDVAKLGNDDEHKAAVIIVDKDHAYEVMHSDLDAHALNQLMMTQGRGVGIATGNGR
ncbi:MAG TPA: hypothetical protein VFR24_14360 [Candidatus Angelobacter sp.]|nr:hypothetical protein [Candidatus Angelobacter sp.]